MNRMVAVGLTWDGMDIQRTDLGVFLEITEGLDELPDMRRTRHIIPFRHGRVASPGYADSRTLVLDGLLAETEDETVRAYVDAVKLAFSPLRDEPGVLIAQLEDGSARWIRAMPDDLLDRVGGNVITKLVSLRLRADDPFWYSDSPIVMDAGYMANAGEVMDGGGEVIVTPTSTVFDTVIDHEGTAPVEAAQVTFYGPSTTSIGFESLDTGVGFTGWVLAAGDVLEVDSALRTARLNGVLDRSQIGLRDPNRHGEYVRLEPGSNRIRITGEPAEVRVRFPATYL